MGKRPLFDPLTPNFPYELIKSFWLSIFGNKITSKYKFVSFIVCKSNTGRDKRIQSLYWFLTRTNQQFFGTCRPSPIARPARVVGCGWWWGEEVWDPSSGECQARCCCLFHLRLSTSCPSSCCCCLLLIHACYTCLLYMPAIHACYTCLLYMP